MRNTILVASLLAVGAGGDVAATPHHARMPGLQIADIDAPERPVIQIADIDEPRRPVIQIADIDTPHRPVLQLTDIDTPHRPVLQLSDVKVGSTTPDFG